MRVGFDAKRATTNFTGLGNYSRSILTNLGNYYPDNQYFLFTTELLKPQLYPNLLNKRIFQIFLPRTGISKRLKSIWRSFSWGKIIEEEGIEIFHGLSGELPLISKKKNTRYVLTVHDLIFYRYPQFYKLIDRIIYKRKLKYSCRIADSILAVSEQTKSDLTEFLKIDPQKISVIYQNCQDQFYERPRPEILESTKALYSLPDRYLLYVGTIEPRKNALELIQAFQKIQEPGLRDLGLVIVGKKTNYWEELNHYVLEHQLEKKVFFYHGIKSTILPHFFQLAEIFVYPSSFEGFGIPILEALVSGTPVITSKGSCFREAGGEGSIYIDPKNISEFSQTIISLLKDKNHQESMKIKGFEHASNFKAQLLVDQLFQLYQKVLKQ